MPALLLQVVMKAMRMSLAPLPFNLVRRAVLLTYAVADEVTAMRRSGALETGASGEAEDEGEPSRWSHRKSREEQQMNRRSSRKMSVGSGSLVTRWPSVQNEASSSNLSAAGEDEKISAFIERAISTQVKLYPEEVVAYDVANAQQSHGHLYRTALSLTVNELSHSMGLLNERLVELHTSVDQKFKQMDARQDKVLAALRRGVQEQSSHAQAI